MASDEHEYEYEPKPSPDRNLTSEDGYFDKEDFEQVDEVASSEPYHHQLRTELNEAVLELVINKIGHLDRDMQKDYILLLMDELRDEAMTLYLTDENGRTRR